MKKLIEWFKNLFKSNKPPQPQAPHYSKPEGVDADLFVANVNLNFGFLSQTQSEGFKFIIKKWNESGLKDLRWLAYMMAITWHETAKTVQPVTEYGSAAYLRGKRYYPYIGRGYVQLTWDYNYRKYGIENDMNKALDPEFAAYIMIDGMTKGIFTGRRLSDYFNDQTNDPMNARRIINGMDRANQIAEYHDKFLICLTSTWRETLS